MKPYLVRTRTPITAQGSGDIVLYTDLTNTEAEALSDVKAEIPENWTVESVVGLADPETVKRLNLQPSKPQRIA